MSDLIFMIAILGWILYQLGILQAIAVVAGVACVAASPFIIWSLAKESYKGVAYYASGQAKADRELNEAREAEYRQYWKEHQRTTRQGTKWNEYVDTYESLRAEYFEKKGWKP